MSNIAPPLARAQDADLSAFKRIAMRERAGAVRDVATRISSWLWSGVSLHYSDDAVTHPAAGKPCGC